MNVAIMEIGDLYCPPDITRVFLTKEKVIENVPTGFDYVDTVLCTGRYYENESDDRGRWLTIKTYDVEQ